MLGEPQVQLEHARAVQGVRQAGDAPGSRQSAAPAPLSGSVRAEVVAARPRRAARAVEPRVGPTRVADAAAITGERPEFLGDVAVEHSSSALRAGPTVPTA